MQSIINNYILYIPYCTGIVPKRFKIAKVVPIFKKDDKKTPSNYRPISLLSIFNKILEKLVSKRLYNFLDHEIFFTSINLVFEKIIILVLQCLKLQTFAMKTLIIINLSLDYLLIFRRLLTQ